MEVYNPCPTGLNIYSPMLKQRLSLPTHKLEKKQKKSKFIAHHGVFIYLDCSYVASGLLSLTQP